MGVYRPPDFVEITVDSAPEYYSLSECWWHMLSALNDLANEESISYKSLEPVIGPCEPHILHEKPEHPKAGVDNVYRILEWWQNDEYVYFPLPEFTSDNILEQIPALIDQAETKGKVGPSRQPTGFPDRQVVMRKVKAFWSFNNELGDGYRINAAEMLYIFAKYLDQYYDDPQSDFTIDFTPSHVLPFSYFEFLKHGRYKYVFGVGSQLKWFDLGQRWSMKPAVLS